MLLIFSALLPVPVEEIELGLKVPPVTKIPPALPNEPVPVMVPPFAKAYVPPKEPPVESEAVMEPPFMVYVPADAPVPEKDREPPLFTATAPLTSLPEPETTIEPLSVMGRAAIVKLPPAPIVSTPPELTVKVLVAPVPVNETAVLMVGATSGLVTELIMTWDEVPGVPDGFQLAVVVQLFEAPTHVIVAA